MKTSIVFSTHAASFSAVTYQGDFEANLGRIAALGYDGVELAVRDPDLLDVGFVHATLARHGLAVPAIGTGQAFSEEGLSFTDPDAGLRRQAVERIRRQVDLARLLGAVVIIGLIRGKVQPGVSRDLAIAGQSARFSTAYMRVALSPDGSSTYFLPRLVGLKKALELFLLGEAFDAAEALRLGLVNRVVPDADLEGATLEIARRLARGPALAMAKAKELVYGSLGESLESQMENERRAIVLCADTDDFREGSQAFFERREPRFG